MIKLITILLEIAWTFIKGAVKQNEEEKAKREKLTLEADEAWKSSDTRKSVDHMWSKLHRK